MLGFKQRVYEILGHLKAPGPGFYLYTNRSNFSFSRKLNKFPKKSKCVKIFKLKWKTYLIWISFNIGWKRFNNQSSFLGENPAGLQLNSSPDHLLQSLHFILLLATFIIVQNFRWRNCRMIQKHCVQHFFLGFNWGSNPIKKLFLSTFQLIRVSS